MMDLDKYLDNLRKNYLAVIPWFVPKYFEMIEQLVRMATFLNADSGLDLGCGPAHLGRQILEKDKNIHLTCVDLCDDMILAAKDNLRSYIHAGRAIVVKKNFCAFQCSSTFDLIIANLFLVNFRMDTKKNFLEKIRDLLSPNGIFIWGDRICFENNNLQEIITEERKAKARANSSLDPEFIKYCFDHEGNDTPLTTAATLKLGEEIFGKADCFWQSSNTALFFIQKLPRLS